MVNIRVISRDGIQMIIPPNYQANSDYFKSVHRYKSQHSPLTLQYDYEVLRTILIPVDMLDNNQLVDSLQVDRFFYNRTRIEEIEYRLTVRWVNCFYHNLNHSDRDYLKNIIIDIIYTNPVCATYIYINRLHHSAYNPDISLLDNERYWIKIKSNLLTNINRKDLFILVEHWNKKLDINDKLTNSEWLFLVNRFNGLPEFLTQNNELGMASNYYAIINNQPCYSRFYSSSLLQLMRYDDLNLTVWNGLYQRIIDRRESIIPHLMYNSDERVIQHIMSMLSISPRDVYLYYDNYYREGNPAVIKVLGLDLNRVLTTTIRLDSFLLAYNSLSISVEFTYPNVQSHYHKILWHIFVNDLNVNIDDLYAVLDSVVDNNRTNEWLWDIIDIPDKIEYIPILRLFHVNKPLAHLFAELGGRIRLNDITNIHMINDNIVDFMLSYNYELNDEDVNFINDHIELYDYQVRQEEIDRLMDTNPDMMIELYDTHNMVTIESVPLHEPSYYDRFSDDREWYSIVGYIDEYKIGVISLEELRDIIVDEGWNSIEYIESTIDYLTHYDPNREVSLTEDEKNMFNSLV